MKECKVRSQPNNEPQIIKLSVRLYGWLLRLGPKEFREAYEEEILKTYRDCCRQAYEHDRICGVLHQWPSVFAEAVLGMCAERFSMTAIEGSSLRSLVSLLIFILLEALVSIVIGSMVSGITGGIVGIIVGGSIGVLLGLVLGGIGVSGGLGIGIVVGTVIGTAIGIALGVKEALIVFYTKCCILLKRNNRVEGLETIPQ